MLTTFVIRQLSCHRQERKLFSDLSFQLDDGHLLLVEGANGSGKSSLLRLLAGLATPASGDIIWQGQSIFRNPTRYKQQIHYLGHSNGFRLDLTALENVPLLKNHSLLTSLQLFDHRNQATRTLSAGQKRKLALARLLLSNKKIWLLDEPLTALDTETQCFFLSELALHLQHGGIAVICSHQPLTLSGMSTQVLRLPI